MNGVAPVVDSFFVGARFLAPWFDEAEVCDVLVGFGRVGVAVGNANRAEELDFVGVFFGPGGVFDTHCREARL